MKAAELGALEQAMAALARPGADPDAEPEPGSEPFKPATRGPQVGARVCVHMWVLVCPTLRCPVTPSADSFYTVWPVIYYADTLLIVLSRYSLQLYAEPLFPTLTHSASFGPRRVPSPSHGWPPSISRYRARAAAASGSQTCPPGTCSPPTTFLRSI